MLFYNLKIVINLCGITIRQSAETEENEAGRKKAERKLKIQEKKQLKSIMKRRRKNS